MARAKRASDEAYNARRRLKRQAARMRKQAASAADGAYAGRLRALADEALKQAQETYFNRETKQYRAGAVREAERLASHFDVADEDIQADILLSSPIGSRIYAGTVEIWRGIEDYNKREDAILKAFGVKRMADVIKLIEKQLGEALYNTDSDERYNIAVLTIMQMVARNGES